MKRIIAFVGMAGSGKSIATDIAVTLGYHRIHFGDLTMDELQRRGLPVSELNERKVREDLRKQHGMAAFAALAIPKIEAVSGNVVIDGLYSWAEYELLKAEYPKMKVIAIYASPKTRYGRLKTRAERPLKEKEAVARDKAELEKLEKGAPIAMADITIINEGSKQQLEEAVRHVI
ncbi:MAG: AAA family ATPase [Nanoarchaeota archaeon]